MANLQLWLIYGCSQSMVTAILQSWPICDAVNLRLQPIYGYSQSTVVANLRLRPVYGCGHSILLLRPLLGKH